MLADEGVSGVGIEAIGGELMDNYDPRSNVLHLSQGNLRGGSCGKCGGGLSRGGSRRSARTWLRARENSFGSRAGRQLHVQCVDDCVLPRHCHGSGRAHAFAIALFAFSVIFQIVTLPVEFDASSGRAVAYVERSGLGPQAVRGAKKVLVAAALTYVAAALVSVLQLLYYLSKTDRRGER